jgi:hypothetical protein
MLRDEKQRRKDVYYACGGFPLFGLCLEEAKPFLSREQGGKVQSLVLSSLFAASAHVQPQISKVQLETT